MKRSIKKSTNWIWKTCFTVFVHDAKKCITMKSCLFHEQLSRNSGIEREKFSWDFSHCQKKISWCKKKLSRCIFREQLFKKLRLNMKFIVNIFRIVENFFTRARTWASRGVQSPWGKTRLKLGKTRGKSAKLGKTQSSQQNSAFRTLLLAVFAQILADFFWFSWVKKQTEQEETFKEHNSLWRFNFDDRDRISRKSIPSCIRVVDQCSVPLPKWKYWVSWSGPIECYQLWAVKIGTFFWGEESVKFQKPVCVGVGVVLTFFFVVELFALSRNLGGVCVGVGG